MKYTQLQDVEKGDDILYSIFQKLLDEHNVTMTEVSRATGINQTVFSNWKQRNGRLSADNLLKIAKYFNVSMEYLLGE